MVKTNVLNMSVWQRHLHKIGGLLHSECYSHFCLEEINENTSQSEPRLSPAATMIWCGIWGFWYAHC